MRRTCSSLSFPLIAIILAIGAGPAQGQTMSFLRQLTTSGMDRATAVGADASGLYVAGQRPSSQGIPGRAGLRKYDPLGNELWARDFTAPAYVTRVAADASGVYLLGTTFGPVEQFFLGKYSASGAELWTRQMEFPTFALAADATGVYVAGGNWSSAYLRKYSSDGAELWSSRFGEIKTVAGVALDATGVYGLVTNSNGAAGVIVRKWDTRGNELWTRQLGALDVHRAFAAATPTGFYLIAAAGADGWVTILRKYDSGGNELWSRQLDPSDLNGSVVADATGIYVAGTPPVRYQPYRPFTVLPGQCRSGSGGDSYVRKYDVDGVEVWTRQFGTADAAWASGLAVNDSGVYVVGQEGTAQVRDDFEHFDAFGPANPTSGAFLAKFEKTAPVVTGSGPRIFPGCVVNAASYVGGGVAPGEIVTLFGSAMGPSELVPLRVTGDGKLATALADTRVLFNGVPAPLVYVSEKQSSAIVPYAVGSRSSVDVQVEYRGVRSEAVTTPVLTSRPGIFSLDGSGEGQGAIQNEDGSLNSPSNPAQRGSIITLYATGGGEAAPGVEDGQILSNVIPRTTLPVSVFFDLGNNEFQVPSKPGEVLYAGGVSGSVAGLLQLNVRVPANAVATGNAVPFVLIIGSHWTVYQVTIALR